MIRMTQKERDAPPPVPSSFDLPQRCILQAMSQVPLRFRARPVCFCCRRPSNSRHCRLHLLQENKLLSVIRTAKSKKGIGIGICPNIMVVVQEGGREVCTRGTQTVSYIQRPSLAKFSWHGVGDTASIGSCCCWAEGFTTEMYLVIFILL
ncbi:hypothetical protein CPB84DRAFT_1781278 [Gymnopilus junonius]|uniref:Uncharacterized protein n=1 Tax=Gymnopilus junonius TaxID=109634 RepID=A0A9P5NJB3_GYMJU|nr:hypothetical protein CPB84DRAFT_1781278 [Gymnopilus junonius]